MSGETPRTFISQGQRRSWMTNESVPSKLLTAYKLKLPPHWKIHSHFNKKLLTPYIPPAFPNQELPPPPLPDLIDGEEEFEVEEVLDSKPCTIRGGRGRKSYTVTDYFVKWKGWTHKHNSWVCDSEMGNAQEAIKEYEAKMADIRRIDDTTPDPKKHVTMILDFKYKNHSCHYLVQCQDRKQKWVVDPDPEVWSDLIKEYWYSTRSDSENDEP